MGRLKETLEDYQWKIHSALASMLGIDEERAKVISTKLDMSDYINVTQALDRNDEEEVRNIMSKYKDLVVEPEESLVQQTESRFVHLSNIDESEISYEKDLLMKEGFNYYAFFERDVTRDKMIDWLDENKVEYLVDDLGHFHVKCEDRDQAYKVGRNVSHLTRVFGDRGLMRDSIEEELEENGKRAERRLSTAKKKEKTMKTRNPVASGAKMRPGAGPHDKKGYDRTKKHKTDYMEEVEEMTEEFKVGERVLVGNEEATVKIPQGPRGTVGVIINDSLHLVEREEIERLDESIIGIASVPGLDRMRELAGIRETAKTEESDDADDLRQAVEEDLPLIGDEDPMGDIDGMGDMPGPDGDMAPPMDMDPGMEPPMDVEPMPGELDDIEALPAPNMAPDMAPDMDMDVDQSDAYASMSASLDSITEQLGNIRLDEYKLLLQRVESLADQVKDMGRGFVMERRRRKQ